jgi:glycosyltransferase involved in cell wall biosynthesis
MSKPISVLHLDDARTWRGGQQQVLYLHRGLLAEGVDSTVVTPAGSALARRLQDEGLPLWTLPLRGIRALPSAWHLARRAESTGAILHSHTAHTHTTGLLCCYFKPRLALVVSRRVDFVPASSATNRWKYRNKHVDRYLAISSGVERVLLASGVSKERIRRVPSGIDLARFADLSPDTAWRKSLGLPEGRKLVGSIAALAPHKDQVILLKAFARMLRMGTDAQLVIFGEGSERARLEDLRQQLGLQERVLLPGFVKEPLSRAACFDLFVLSSVEEGLGTAILDAMAMRQAVVATAAGGIPDAVVDRETGRLVPPKDVEGLAHAMASLLKDPALARRYGEAGRKRVEEHFEVRRTVSLTLAAYRELEAPSLADSPASSRY